MPKRVYWVKPTQRRDKILRVVNIFVVLALGGALAGFLALVSAYVILSHDLPKLDTIDDYRPNLVSFVYDETGKIIGEFKYENQRRILLTYDQFPEILINAVVSAEDAGFWKHEGLDYAGIMRALIRNVLTGSFSQGGSTITQQVTRSLLLTKEKTLTRKIKEMILAQKIEQKLSKPDILTLYLNEIYFGNGAYGVQAAAQNYFDKNVEELTLGEVSLLAGLPQAPSRYAPYRNPDSARARQKYVLSQMVREKYITQEQADAAFSEPWDLHKVKDINKEYAPYFVEHVRQLVMKKYGFERVLKEGFHIHTTLNLKLQRAADRAVDMGLRELDKRHGWRGPLRHLEVSEVKPYLKKLAKRQQKALVRGTVLEGVVIELGSDAAWVSIGDLIGKMPLSSARWIDKIEKGKKTVYTRVKNLRQILNPYDVIQVKVIQSAPDLIFGLDQPPKAQAALLAMEPQTRFVKAIVGGRSFEQSQFNRVIQAKRQPGSSFKPVVYAAALDAGMTPATIIMDTALVFKDGWRPGNYDGKFKGEMTLREALTKSVNTVTIRIVGRITADYVYRYAHRLGIRGLTGADLSMALGTYEIAPLELINAYAVFASGGKLGDPIFIKRIEDPDGEIVEQTIITADAIPVPAMENVPDVSDWSDAGKDLEEGADEDVVVADPVAQRQFYEDFGLTKKKDLPDTPKDIDVDTSADEQGKVAFKQVIDEETAYLITSMMHSVATRGTGARSNRLGKIVAGKTGTTNDYVDAWFVGFSPDLLAGVWVGNDAGSKPLGRSESGSKAALPIWINFMERALADQPNKDFHVPKGITVAKIDPKTGLLANPTTEGAYNEYFKAGTEPTEYAPTEDAVDPDSFFDADLEDQLD